VTTAVEKKPDLVNDPGLRRKFAAGEGFAWKGIWFKVESVDYDRITLKAEGMTWAQYKKLKKEINR
jgi:hypothetical protein